MALHEPIMGTLLHIHFISHHLSLRLLQLMSSRQIRGGGGGICLGAWALQPFNGVELIKRNRNKNKKMESLAGRNFALHLCLLTTQKWKRWYFFRILILHFLKAAVIMEMGGCSILTVCLNIDAFACLKLYNMQPVCIHTCRGNNIITAAELFGVAALALSCFWCVWQKLFNLLDIKAGDTSAGAAFPSWKVVVEGGVGGGVDPRVAIHHIPLSTLGL